MQEPEDAQEELANGERLAEHDAFLPPQQLPHFLQHTTLSPGAAEGEQDKKQQGKEAVGVAEVGAVVAKGVAWVAHSCQSILFLIAHSRIVSCAVMLIILWKLLTPAAQAGAWGAVRGLPILGTGFDLAWQALDYWDALFKVKFTYAHMPGQQLACRC